MPVDIATIKTRIQRRAAEAHARHTLITRRKIAQVILSHPEEALKLAQENLENLRMFKPEWKRILTKTPQEVAKFILGEYGYQEILSCHPFGGILPLYEAYHAK